MRTLFSSDVLVKDKKDPKKILDVDYELFRRRMFDSIYGSLWKSKEKNELILAFDGKQSWRKIYWPKYKEHRKGQRDKLDLDWDEFYGVLNSYIEELSSHFPFKCIKIDNTEADDIIAVLCASVNSNFTVISTDKDFLQLSAPNVKIYDPLKKKEVKHPNPELFIVEQCLRGQAKDNIFNIKTPLDYPDDKRKPAFGEKAFEKVVAYGWKKWLNEEGLEERFNYNRNLIDFEKIPSTIRNRVLKEYRSYKYPDPEMIWKFFEKHQWPDLIDNFTQIENKILEIY